MHRLKVLEITGVISKEAKRQSAWSAWSQCDPSTALTWLSSCSFSAHMLRMAPHSLLHTAAQEASLNNVIIPEHGRAGKAARVQMSWRDTAED